MHGDTRWLCSMYGTDGEHIYNLDPIINGKSEIRIHLNNTRVQAKIILKCILKTHS
jgi:hypothetical protein